MVIVHPAWTPVSISDRVVSWTNPARCVSSCLYFKEERFSGVALSKEKHKETNTQPFSTWHVVRGRHAHQTSPTLWSHPMVFTWTLIRSKAAQALAACQSDAHQIQSIPNQKHMIAIMLIYSDGIYIYSRNLYLNLKGSLVWTLSVLPLPFLSSCLHSAFHAIIRAPCHWAVSSPFTHSVLHS